VATLSDSGAAEETVTQTKNKIRRCIFVACVKQTEYLQTFFGEGGKESSSFFMMASDCGPPVYFKDKILCYIKRFNYTPTKTCQKCKDALARNPYLRKMDVIRHAFVSSTRQLMCGQHTKDPSQMVCIGFFRKCKEYVDLTQYLMARFHFFKHISHNIPVSAAFCRRSVTPNDLFLVEMRHFFCEIEAVKVVPEHYSDKLSYFLTKISPSLSCAYLLGKASFPLHFVYVMREILVRCEKTYYKYSEPRYVLYLYTEYVIERCHVHYQTEWKPLLEKLKNNIGLLNHPPLPFYCTAMVHYFIHEYKLDIYPGPRRRRYEYGRTNSSTDKNSFTKSPLAATVIGLRGNIESYFDTYEEMVEKLQYTPKPIEDVSKCGCFHCSKECLLEVLGSLQEGIVQLKCLYPKDFNRFYMSFYALTIILELYINIVHHVTPPNQRKVQKSALAFSFYYIWNYRFGIVIPPQQICSAFSLSIEQLHAAELCAYKHYEVTPTSFAAPSFLALNVLLKSDVPIYIALLVKDYLSIIEGFFWSFEDSASMVYFALMQVMDVVDYRTTEEMAHEEILGKVRVCLFCMDKFVGFKLFNPIKMYFQCTLNVCAERHFLLKYQKNIHE
jgi:hypothetical protein